jgi:ABC-type glycerol-3-phosphate transport system permease component
MDMSRESVPARLINYLVLIVMTLLVIIPLTFSILTTLKTPAEYIQNPLGLPHQLYLDNYVQIFQKFDFLRLLLNSLILTMSSVVIGCYVSVMAAFAFGKMEFRGRALLSTILIPVMSVPAIVMVIPLFSLFSDLKLVNSFAAPIIIYVGLIVPFSIYLVTSFMDSIPNEIIEAAMMEGLGTMGLFHRIILPLSLPAISTVMITQGMWIWNELLIAFIFLPKENMRTIMVGLTSIQGLYTTNIPLMITGAVIVSLPLILAFVFSQKYVIRGLVEGAVK